MGLIDEVRDHDADQLSNVVLPLMNVKRRNNVGKINEFEPQPQQLWMSSASNKSSYCYEQLIESLEEEIISPNSTFVFGCDYRVPMMHGLLDKQYINSMKMSSTFKDDSFAREYLGHFTGANEDSWFDYNKISSHRKLLNPEFAQKIRAGDDCFYFISVDVGRYNCQTVAMIWKVYRSQSGFRCNLVNIFILSGSDKSQNFMKQAIEIKKLIAAFNPIEVVIDGNGLGAGLMDFMVLPSVDGQQLYPGYRAINDSDYNEKAYPDTIPLIFVLKSNATLDGKIHANCYTMLSSGKITFLAREQEIKNKLNSTIKGQKMSFEKRAARLIPHELTTRLIEEMSNLKLKQAGAGLDIKLELVNTNMGKDKFSAFEYGLWRIKALEDEYLTKIRKKSRKNRTLTFYTVRG